MPTQSHALAFLAGDSSDQQLLANLHPSDWKNPEPASSYNLVVIGGGTAGLISAAGAAGLGAKVALIERGLLGGDCLNVGCVPSKALLRAARAAIEGRRAGIYGVTGTAEVKVDFGAVMERMRRLRAELSAHDSAARYRGMGVDVFIGQGRFCARDCVEVDGRRLRFRHAVIATGTRADTPAIPGLAATGFLTNETVFSLTALPRRIAVIGAGPAGCEMAQALSSFGSAVTMLEAARRILPGEDRDAAEVLKGVLSQQGIEVIEDCKIGSVELRGVEKIIRLEGGRRNEVVCDEILVTTGRRPALDGLDLETAGVAYDPRAGVIVNDRLQTTNKRIFAAGDICSQYKFTHVADAMARIVIRNALFAGRERVSALTIPACIYTSPEIARAGLSESQARERGIPVTTFVQPLGEIDRAVLDGETAGFVKIHVRAGSDKPVGATIVAAHAGEMISELTLAMANGLGMASIARTIHPYPTQAEAIRRLGDAYNRTRLTPRVASVMRRWLGWTR